MRKYFFFILLFLVKTASAELDLSEMEKVKSRLHDSINAPRQDCKECEHDSGPIESSHEIRLDNRSIEVETRYRGGSHPHIIKAIRTEDSPERVELTIHYDQRYCADDLSQFNPLTGRLLYRCLVHKSEKREKTIHIDFRKSPKLASGQEEVYQIKLNKELDDKDIEEEVGHVRGPRKNVEIKEEKSFLGLFGRRYVVE